MKFKPLHDPAGGTLRLVGLMSGSGTNLCRVLEHEWRLNRERGRAPFHICGIFSDTWDCRAAAIGKEYNLPVITHDIRAWYRALGQPRTDMALRAQYDAETVRLLAPLDAAAAVYAGYMSIASSVLSNAFLGINVHPADLSVKVNGRRRWVGANVVRDAILAGERLIRSTTHLVEPEVDGGRLLMLSQPLPVLLPAETDLSDKQQLAAAAGSHQQRLKEAGDWVILPRTIEYIADGRYAADGQGRLYFDGRAIPDGLQAEE